MRIRSFANRLSLWIMAILLAMSVVIMVVICVLTRQSKGISSIPSVKSVTTRNCKA